MKEKKLHSIDFKENNFTGDLKNSFVELNQETSSIAKQITKVLSTFKEEFDFVGSDIQNIEFRAKELSTLSSITAEKISGEGAQKALEGIWSNLNSICIHFMLTKDQAQENLECLLNIKEYLYEFRSTMDGFNKIIKMLNMLGTLTRIEGTRLTVNNNTFLTIAEDVQELADQIKSKCPDVQEQAEWLIDHIEDNLERLQKLVSHQNVNIDLTLETAQKDLESVFKSQDARIKFAKHISKLTKSIHQTISKVGDVIQVDGNFIKELEPGISELTEIYEHIKSTSIKITDSFSLSEELNKANDQCIVVQGLLNGYWTETEAKLKKITHTLFSLKDLIIDSNPSQTSLDNSFASETSFLQEVEKDIQGIAVFASENDKVNQEIFVTMSSLAKKAANLSTYIDSIKEIGSNIQLIGVNAQIKAANAGERGKAIGVLAEEIHKISIDAHNQTNIVFKKLGEVSAFGKKLISENDSSSQSFSSDIDEVVESMRVKMTSLIEINQSVDSLLDRLRAEEIVLFEDIKKVTSKLSNHKVQKNFIDEIIFDLASIERKSQALLFRQPAMAFRE